VLLDGGSVGGRGMDLLICLLLPLLVGVLKTVQPGNLVGAVNHGEQGVELGFDLLICVMQRLKEDWVSGQKVATQTGLFVDHQFDEPIGVEND
jgi:hypothetical protein